MTPAPAKPTVPSVLETIVEHKRREVAAARARTPEDRLEKQLQSLPPTRDFRAAITVHFQSAERRPPEPVPEIRFIAEVKKASPSAGILRHDFDPVAIARIYADHGAAAISVLTDERFFQGSLAFLSAIRQSVSLPLLRKDFILDRYQLVEARVAGADAVLLIAEILSPEDLPRLVREAHALGLEALVEFYEPTNFGRVLGSGTRIVGVNNRDLRSFETRLDHTFDVVGRLPPGYCLVSESGIRTRADVVRLAQAGVHAVLVGETLMRAPDVGAKLRELRGVAND